MAETPVDLGWCIVELMGHVRLAGRVREQPLFSVNMLRLDIPGEGEAWLSTQYIGGASLYRVTPCGEEIARAVAARSQPEPAHRWELPPAYEPAPPAPYAESALFESPSFDEDAARDRTEAAFDEAEVKPATAVAPEPGDGIDDNDFPF